MAVIVFARWLRLLRRLGLSESMLRRGRRARAEHCRRLQVECLEDRTVPSVTLSPAALAADTINVPYNTTITAGGGTGAITLTVSNIQNAIPGLNVPASGTGTLAVTGIPTATGTETFAVTATDSLNNTTTADYAITVRNAVPTLSSVSISSAMDLGNQATLSGTINGPANQPFTLDVNWGDGTATQSFNLPAGTTTFSEPHTYLTAGAYTPSLSVGDSDYSNDLLYGSTGGASPNPGQLYVFDLGTGSETLVGNLPGNNVTEIAANPATGQAWLQYGSNLYEGQQFNINTGAGIGSVIHDVTHDNFNALTYIGNTVYAAGTPATGGTSPSSLFTLIPSTGIATLIGATGYNGPVSGIAYDAANGTLYGIEGGSGSAFHLISLNPSTGAATNVLATGFAAGSLSLGPDGQLYAGSSTGQLYSINVASQTVTPRSFAALPSAVSGLTMGNDTANVQVTVLPSASAAALSTYETSDSFNVGYSAADGPGGSGIASVSLWYTTNGGSSWTQSSLTPSGNSFSFTASADGSYGFYVQASDNAGYADPTPSGAGSIQAATLVDTTAPTASASALPNYNTSDNFNVGYTASDAGSGVASVSLWYTSNGGSTWTQSSATAADGAFNVTASAAGNYGFYVQAIDNAGNADAVPTTAANIQAHILVDPVITLSPATLPADAINVGYDQAITATGGTGAITLTVGNISNALAGLSVPSGGTTSLIIGGTPTVAGTETFTVTATDALGNTTGPQQYSVTVTPAGTLTLSPATLVPGAVSSSYGPISISASGGFGAYTFTLATGSKLPPGLALSDGGAVSGTPTTAGAFAFTIVATDNAQPSLTGQLTYSITVTSALLVSPATLPTATVGDNFNAQLTATGGSGNGYSFTAANLPGGLTLSSTGLLSGTPTETTGSPLSITVTVTDSNNVSRNFNYSLTIDPAITVSTSLAGASGSSALPVATVGDRFSTQLAAAGGSGKGFVFTGAQPARLAVALPHWFAEWHAARDGWLIGKLHDYGHRQSEGDRRHRLHAER